MIVEWNTHIFSPDTAKYPLHEKAAYRPDLSQHPQDPLAAYLEHMRTEAIDRAVIVHPEPYGDDHRLVLDCLAREPEIFRGTSLFYPHDLDAPKKLEDLVAQEPKIIATRFHAHRGKEMYLDSFAEKGVRALWEKAVELGLIIELHIGPDYAEQVGQVLRDIPETVALIDHLAEPQWGSAVEFAHILELGSNRDEFKEVYMKLSGLSHFASDAPFYESARPFTKRVVEAFGAERLVWGSGSPDIVDIHMQDFSAVARDKVKGGNLAKLLNFE
ncbi:MAG: putative TIM-barrel fold metal-dependent hydrolase [Candidatus Latescibacterota bacterium]|jgi:predicted TIM-barrel fold metal-dependent hydrolase